jgi:ribonuclease BN (tRNA processing enzyme)
MRSWRASMRCSEALRVGTCAVALTFAACIDAADRQRLCGETGVWIQILGSGGEELTDARASSGYLVWRDDAAKLLVDPGPGSALRFEEGRAKFDDVDAVVFTSLKPDHSVELPAFVQGGGFGPRNRVLPVLGPDGNDAWPSTRAFVERLIGPHGAYPALAGYLQPHAENFHLDVTDVPASGARRWARFGTAALTLAAFPVHDANVPSLAWRVTLGTQSITFTGDFNNAGDTLVAFAKGSDALVIDHSIEEGARGEVRTQHVMPSQIGSIASRAGVRMVILGHRTSRTRGRESLSEQAIRAHYAGPLIFADDNECWGL